MKPRRRQPPEEESTMAKYTVLKSEDLEEVEAGDGVSQVILKEGAEGVDFEVENAVGPDDLAKLLIDAADAGDEGDAEPLVKFDSTPPAPEPDEELRKAVSEGFAKLGEQLAEQAERLKVLEQSPGARPMVLPAPGSVLVKSSLDRVEGDDADKDAIRKADQLTYDRIGGHEGTTQEEAVTVAQEWARSGEVNRDPEKRRLSDALANTMMGL